VRLGRDTASRLGWIHRPGASCSLLLQQGVADPAPESLNRLPFSQFLTGPRTVFLQMPHEVAANLSASVANFVSHVRTSCSKAHRHRYASGDTCARAGKSAASSAGHRSQAGRLPGHGALGPREARSRLVRTARNWRGGLGIPVWSPTGIEVPGQMAIDASIYPQKYPHGTRAYVLTSPTSGS
jgi:hypothetical protein